MPMPTALKRSHTTVFAVSIEPDVNRAGAKTASRRSSGLRNRSADPQTRRPLRPSSVSSRRQRRAGAGHGRLGGFRRPVAKPSSAASVAGPRAASPRRQRPPPRCGRPAARPQHQFTKGCSRQERGTSRSATWKPAASCLGSVAPRPAAAHTLWQPAQGAAGASATPQAPFGSSPRVAPCAQLRRQRQVIRQHPARDWRRARGCSRCERNCGSRFPAGVRFRTQPEGQQ